MRTRTRLPELTGKKHKIGVNELQLRGFKNELPKLLFPFNSLRGVIKSVLQTDKVKENYNDAFKQLADHIMKGFPDGTKISFASRAKGFEGQFSSANRYLNECKDIESKHERYMKYLILKDNKYEWDASIENLLSELAGRYVIGETAIAIHGFVAKFLDDFETLLTLQNNRLLANPAIIVQATPLLMHDIDLLLKPNNEKINELAQVIESQELNKSEKAVLKIMKINVQIEANEKKINSNEK